jgi:hypothetical protein
MDTNASSVGWLEELESAVNAALPLLEQTSQLARRIAASVPVVRFPSILRTRDALDDVVKDLELWGKHRLLLCVYYDCRVLAEALTTLFQTFKVPPSHSSWRPVHSVKFPLPPGQRLLPDNVHTAPLVKRVLSDTTEAVRYAQELLKTRLVFVSAARGPERRISCSGDGRLFSTANRLSWEMWKLEDAEPTPNTFFIASLEHDICLSCNAHGSLFMTQNRFGWERWCIEGPFEACRIVSVEHHRVLSLQLDGTILTKEPHAHSDEDLWRIEPVVAFLPPLPPSDAFSAAAAAAQS